MTKFIQIVLFPFSLLYGLIMWIRNLLFQFNIFTSRKFDIPVIGVGNLSYGGTGKTPHIEYLIRLLSEKNFIATLSRGYGRKSKGFNLATEGCRNTDIGDEPMQFFSKFKKITVAVDEKRARGIRHLLSINPPPEIILLDDSFQHRYVKPGLSVLLTDYRKLYYEDFVLPSGTLREFASGSSRADIIVVTKTPKIFSPITRKRILEEMKADANQLVCFSYISYGAFQPVFDETTEFPAKVISILLFSGIANDYPLREHLERQCSDLTVIKFPDHHYYNEKDIRKIIQQFHDLPTQKKILVTTEKDSMRLKNDQFSAYFKNLPLFCIPIEIDFHGNDKKVFDEAILKYVAENNRKR